MLKAEKNRVVTIRYTLRGEDGEVIDTNATRSGGGLSYLHGAGNIVAGLERALEGEGEGYEAEVEVAAKDGYGEVEEGLKILIPHEKLDELGKVEVGTKLRADTPMGMHLFEVTRIDERGALIDGNHPLAGKVLYFEVKLEGVREATDEEVGRGYADGGTGDAVAAE